jgi:HEPN domain-containing protein
MPDTETARLIVSAAKRDLQVLENMLDPSTFPGEIFGFHAQQAVEKALKGWLVMLNHEYPRTHNIRQLLLLLENAGVNVESLWKFVDLTAFAVQFRYEAYEDLDEEMDDNY